MQNYKISNYYRNVLRFFWLLQLFVKIKKNVTIQRYVYDELSNLK